MILAIVLSSVLMWSCQPVDGDRILGKHLAAAHPAFAAIAPDRRFAAWREAMSTLFEVSYDGREDAATYPAAVDAFLFGDLMLADSHGARQSYERGAAKLARDGVDCFFVQVWLDGSGGPRNGGSERWAGAGDLFVVDAAQPMATASTRYRNATLTVPRRLLAPLLRAPEAHHLQVLSGGTPIASLLGEHIRALVRSAPSMSVEDGLALIAPTVQLIAAALEGTIPETLDGVRRALLGAIRRHIDDHLCDRDLSPETIAMRFGISRATLYRLFEPHGGVAAYVRGRRLRQALYRLADPASAGRSIADIALGCGFVNQPDFSRAFRYRFGLVPREARQLALAPPVAARNGATGPEWTRWLRGVR